MKRILLSIVFFVIGILVFAQQNYDDVVYLKNGSIIRGTIIEQVPNVYISIQTYDKNVFVYKLEEIEKITKEPKTSVKASTFSDTDFKTGYCGILNFGYGFGIGDGNDGINTINFDFINGFQLFPYFSAGIGTGVKVWKKAGYSSTPILIPLFLDLRGYFLFGKVSPFLCIDIGYCWEVSPITQGLGLLFSPTAGVSIVIGNKSRLNIGTGYAMQRINIADHAFSSWNLSIGISF